MSCDHIMIDLETMGSRPGCAIATIGAVMFDPVHGDIGNSFYCRVNLRSCTEAGLHLDPLTLIWWLRQSDAARAEISNDESLQLRYALQAFSAFYAENKARKHWSHGAGFDGPIMDAAYHALGMDPPWKFWDARDTRTIFDLAQVKPDRSVGVAHHAHVDAENQARAVVEAYLRLGLAKRTADSAVTHG